MLKNYITDPQAVREKWVAHELRLVARLRARRAAAAGTDAPPVWEWSPARASHRELARFVAAGLSPRRPCKRHAQPGAILGKTVDFGAVAKRKIADLVLLDASPLEDIANTRRIAAVVANGRSTREDLDGILNQVEGMRRRARGVVDLYSRTV
jgi:imidazolonepropionase-like amidohydrolase